MTKYRTIYHSDKEDIVNLFVGKSVKKVGDDKLLLSDGKELTIVPNEGGCICGAGDYDLTELNECENIITNVELEIDEDDRWGPTTYSIFVYAGHTKINLATIQGDDGNGYYGTGFWITVSEQPVEG